MQQQFIQFFKQLTRERGIEERIELCHMRSACATTHMFTMQDDDP